MEPPPAPISMSSTAEMLSGNPLPGVKRRSRAASKLWATRGAPSRTTASFAVVPPMSKARRSRAPERPPNTAAASAPAAGPDSSSRTGTRFASSTCVSPPLESMRKSGAAMPSAAMSRARRSR